MVALGTKQTLKQPNNLGVSKLQKHEVVVVIYRRKWLISPLCSLPSTTQWRGQSFPVSHHNNLVFLKCFKTRGCWVVSVLILFGNPKRCQPQQPRVFEVFRNTEVAGLFQSLSGNPKRRNHNNLVFSKFRNTEVAGTTTTTSCFWKHRWVVSVFVW